MSRVRREGEGCGTGRLQAISTDYEASVLDSVYCFAIYALLRQLLPWFKNRVSKASEIPWNAMHANPPIDSLPLIPSRMTSSLLSG